MFDVECEEGLRTLSEKMQKCSTSDTDNQVSDAKVLETRTRMEFRNKIQSSIKPINYPEKIMFVIDATSEMNSTHFELGRGDKFPPLFMIKRVVEIFINVKSMINPNHEFALYVLNGNDVCLLQPFSSNTSDFLQHIDDIEEFPTDNSAFDLGNLFDKIGELVVKKSVNSVTRVILIYCRSHATPKFATHKQSFDSLMKRQRFFLDILYIHEHPSESNACDAIYSALNSLDVKNSAYIFEVGRNATRLHDNMVKLVAHPLQRPLQRDAHYSLQAHITSSYKESHTSV